MDARELLDDLESGLIDEFMTAEVKAIYIRALRLLAVIESAEGETPETDAFVSVRFGQMVCSHAELRDLARRLERERNAALKALEEEREDAERWQAHQRLTWKTQKEADAYQAAIDAARSKP